MIPSLNTPVGEEHPDAPSQLVAVAFDAWTPKVETALIRHLMQLQFMFPDLSVTASTLEGTVAEHVQRCTLRLGLTWYAGGFSAESTPHLVYFNDSSRRPQPNTDEAITKFTFVGQDILQRRMTPGGRDYPTFPDRTRPAPPNQSPNFKPMPQRGLHSLLPFWAYL